MPLYDMHCPECRENRGEELFRTFAEYDDITRRPSCEECGNHLERKPVQGPHKKGVVQPFVSQFYILGRGQ